MKCDAPISIKLDAEKSAKHGVNYVPVACGKCTNCKKRKISQWSFRLMKELEVSTSSYFITLTYDTLHVPISENGMMTLVKNSKQNENLPYEHKQDLSLQAFFKRLRYYEEDYKNLYDTKIKKVKQVKKLRYYACGEYGTVRKRPHYHIILFNLVSETSIKKAWATAKKDDKGIVIDYIPFGSYDIQEVNNNTIDYVLKYICKDGFNKMHSNDDRIKEFALMSKGLGKNFITPEIESFYNRRLDINYTINDKGHKVAMPKYYRDKMFTEETKEDSALVIKRNVEYLQELEETKAKIKGINLDEKKQSDKFGRQAKQKNYSSRNID